jgi:hypothetical protein
MTRARVCEPHSWRSRLVRRLGWSFGAASLWIWGLLLLRMLREGLQPLDVWFSYSLSFFTTAVYVYLGLLIYASVVAEAGRRGDAATRRRGEGATAGESPPRCVTLSPLLSRVYKPLSVFGVAGLATALVSLIVWVVLRYPGPQAVSGTYGSLLLALMVLGVAAVGTLTARGADGRRPTTDHRRPTIDHRPSTTDH